MRLIFDKLLRKVVKSNIYLMQIAHLLIEKLDIFLPLEPEYEIVKFLAHDDNQIILDIGAHKAESLRSFRLYDNKSIIFSVEANPAHKKTLDKCKKYIKNFQYLIASASDVSGDGELYVPVYCGKELSAWASSSKDQAIKILTERTSLADLNTKLEFKTISIKSIALDELNLEPFFVKIDVEGTEAKIIKGMIKTIEKNFPVFMIEKNNNECVLEVLKPFAYKPFVYNASSKTLYKYIKQDVLNLIYISNKYPYYEQLLNHISDLP